MNRLHLCVKLLATGAIEVVYAGDDIIAAEDAFQKVGLSESIVEIGLFKHLSPVRRKKADAEPIHESSKAATAEQAKRAAAKAAAAKDARVQKTPEQEKAESEAAKRVSEETARRRQTAREQAAADAVRSSRTLGGTQAAPKPDEEKKSDQPEQPKGVLADLLKLPDEKLAEAGLAVDVTQADGQSREDFAKAIAVAAGYKVD